MNFTHKLDAAKKLPCWLSPGSIVVLAGETRYDWMHGIPARKSDTVDDIKRARARRVSLTFRKAIF